MTTTDFIGSMAWTVALLALGVYLFAAPERNETLSPARHRVRQIMAIVIVLCGLTRLSVLFF